MIGSDPPARDAASVVGAGVEWRLRMAAAERGVWTGTQLRRLLAERSGVDLSPASVSALFTKQPVQVKLSTLAALCTALGCAPGDLLILHPMADSAALASVSTGPRSSKPEGPRASPATHQPQPDSSRRSLPPL
ncbi:helix-turn-helix transcriptional regulator [Streptomyces sp. NPDC002138]|uniref:helix-turn-helix domain-containing protein n=1 Tax=Streptomyces sp. NPDC002138 TaxID=3154410 RepID=UPI003327A5E7